MLTRSRMPPAVPDPDEWMQPKPDLLPGADLLPNAGPRPAAGLLPPAWEPMAQPVDLASDWAAEEPIRRHAAPRRSGPAPGWNPDSEEDWLRVLRGLRSPEDS